MFERYTQAARRVIFFGRYFAGRAGNTEIETEHLLLGLFREDKGLGRRFLGSPWAAEKIWVKITESKPVRERISGPVELPLSSESKRALAFAAEETDLFGIEDPEIRALRAKRVCTEHILLGLLREEKWLAHQILVKLGVHLVETRAELMRVPHNDAANEEFSRERGSRPEDIVELQNRIQSIRSRMEDAISKHDFAAARTYSDEEVKERDKFFLLCQKHGLLDWIYD